MKKLRKLSINPEKVINNEELLNLRVGYSDKHYLDCKGSWGGFFVRH